MSERNSRKISGLAVPRVMIVLSVMNQRQRKMTRYPVYLLKVFQPSYTQIFLQVCQFWLQEKCNKPHCKFRHLEDKRDPSVNR